MSLSALAQFTQPSEKAALQALQRWVRNGADLQIDRAMIQAYLLVRTKTKRPKLEDVLATHGGQRTKQESGLRMKRTLVLVPKANFPYGLVPTEAVKWVVDPQNFVSGFEFAAQVDLTGMHVFDYGILRTPIDLGVGVAEVEVFSKLSDTSSAGARQFADEDEPEETLGAPSVPEVGPTAASAPAATPSSAASAPASAASALATEPESQLAKRRRLVREISEEDQDFPREALDQPRASRRAAARGSRAGHLLLDRPCCAVSVGLGAAGRRGSRGE